jgi:hypothetical protein
LLNQWNHLFADAKAGWSLALLAISSAYRGGKTCIAGMSKAPLSST